MTLATVITLGVIAIALVSLAGHAGTIASAMLELSRIAGREHAIRERQRAEQDLTNVRQIEEGRR